MIRTPNATRPKPQLRAPLFTSFYLHWRHLVAHKLGSRFALGRFLAQSSPKAHARPCLSQPDRSYRPRAHDGFSARKEAY